MDKKQRQALQEVTQALLKTAGIAYDDWLSEQHMQYVMQHSGTIAAALAENK